MFVGTGEPRKPRERAEARTLRQSGLSYKRIASALNISPSSAFNWTQDIQLTPEQIEHNIRGPRGPQSPELIARRAAAVRALGLKRRSEFQENGRLMAKRMNPLHLAGCMLYWAEGAKDKNTLKLANSDPAMVRLFVRFLRECFRVPDGDLIVRVNVYLGNGLSVDDVHRFWLDQLQLPADCLRKPTINHFPTSSSGTRVNKLPYGVCTLGARRGTPIVQHIFGAIQEYAGFEESAWLG